MTEDRRRLTDVSGQTHTLKCEINVDSRPNLLLTTST